MKAVTAIAIYIFLKGNQQKLICLQKSFYGRLSTIYPSIFLGRLLWADNISPRMKSIAPRH